MDTLSITRAALDTIVAHARRDAPDECCGLLVGRGSDIDEAVPTANEIESQTRYRVDPREHFALIKALRGTSRAIIGAYHSHPAGSATPSPTDLAEAYSPDFVYLIVSLEEPARPDVRAFRLAGGEPTELSLTIG